MIRRALALAFAGIGFAIASGAQAGTPYEMEVTCPVGGETFSHTATGSYSTMGSRPDGKPYGSWTFPIPMPECPDNGLVLYRDFEEAEVPALTALVLSDEYRALSAETSYYRAQWLYDRLDDGAGTPPYLLMRAGWQADRDTSRKARYQREFAERAEGFAVEDDTFETLALRYRVANAWRELGEFDRALAALDSIPPDALDVAVPARSEAGDEAVQDAESRRYLLEQIGPMRALILARNTQSEPLTLIPEDIAIYRCATLIEENAMAPDPFCTAPERAAELAEAREQRRARQEYAAD